jgi:transcriptional regulator with XRE-family HTH domain
MDATPTIGQQLAEIMRRRYIAPIDVARALAVSPTLVGRWLRGEALPSKLDIEDLAALLGDPDARLLIQAADSLPDATAAGAGRASGAFGDAEAPAQDPAPGAHAYDDAAALRELPAPFRAAFAAALARPHPEPS